MIAAVAALFAACSETDTFKEAAQEQGAEKALSFSAYADKVTKGSNSAALNDFYTVFGVYGWKTVNGTVVTDKPVFSNTPNEYFTVDGNGETVYKTSGKPSVEWTLPSDFGTGEGKKGYWYYENVRYWDKAATNYQFFAIAPYMAEPIYSVAPGDANIAIATAASKYDISTENNLALAGSPIVPQANLSYSGYNKDFMISEKVSVDPHTAGITSSDVNLVFHHVLAKLNVKIQKADGFTNPQNLKVNKLEIAGLAKKGNYVYTTNFTTKGWATEETYTYPINTEYSLNAQTNYSGCYWVEKLIFPQVTTCKALGLQANATALTDMYLYIQYQIGDNQIYDAYYDFANIWGATVINDGTNTATNSFEFKQGYEYNLTLTVGPEPIHFEATVTQWADTTNPINQNVDID